MAWINAQVAEVKKAVPNPATIGLDTMFVRVCANGKGLRISISAVEKYQRQLAADPPADTDLTRVGYEAWFDHFEPFYYALYLDLTAFCLTMGAWFGWNRLLNRTAFWVLVLTLAVHTLGLVSRIYISGRPPVTNLYSAAVFIGWAGMVAGLSLEVIYRLGIGNLIASVAGFATLLIAHFLASGGDTATDRAAGRARHTVLVGDPRRLRDAWLRGHLRRRIAGHHLHLPLQQPTAAATPSSAARLPA